MRLLAPTGSRSGDYTTDTRRAIDQLAALDASELEQLTLRARRIERALEAVRAGERGQRPFATRLRRARTEAQAKRIDIRRQLFELERAMHSGRSEACIERRLQALEQRVMR